MNKINKKSILATLTMANDIHTVVLDARGEVYLKKLTVGELNTLLQLEESHKNEPIIKALYMILYSLCDEQGARLFEDNDIEALKNMDQKTMEHLTVHINRINGFDTSHEQLKKS